MLNMIEKLITGNKTISSLFCVKTVKCLKVVKKC